MEIDEVRGRDSWHYDSFNAISLSDEMLSHCRRGHMYMQVDLVAYKQRSIYANVGYVYNIMKTQAYM